MAVIARASFAAAVLAMVLASCTSIDEPAPLTRPEAGSFEAPVDDQPYDRCRVLDRRFVTDVQARVYGDPAGPQAVCVTLGLPIPAAGPGALVFCVAGVLDSVSVPRTRDLKPDLATCAYCTDLQTNCTAGDADAVAPPTCALSYAVLKGRARIVRLGRSPGESVWIDLGDLEVARVTYRDETRLEVERRDCLFADGLTLQGVLEAGSADTCSGVEETACAIARTAALRSP